MHSNIRTSNAVHRTLAQPLEGVFLPTEEDEQPEHCRHYSDEDGNDLSFLCPPLLEQALYLVRRFRAQNGSKIGGTH